MRTWMIGLAGGLALMGAMPSVSQEGSEGAEAFVRVVFQGYVDEGEANWPLGDSRLDRVWSTRMAGLIRRDRELSVGDLPYLDADPLCQCQDWGDFRVVSVQIRNAPGAGRRAVVTFSNFGERETTILDLSGDPNSDWRIDDVVNPGHPGLAEELTESNRLQAAGRPALGRD